MPQMFGSIRACCAATTELEDFREEGIQWGDRKLSMFIRSNALRFHCLIATSLGWFWTRYSLAVTAADLWVVGEGDKFRHAGFSAAKVEPIIPGELYCGRKTCVLD